MLAQAQGMQQSSQQTGGLTVVDLGEERRVWHGEMAYREAEEEGVMVGRWGRGVSVVGEMRFEGPGVGPSFLKAEKDLLGCSVRPTHSRPSFVCPVCPLTWPLACLVLIVGSVGAVLTHPDEGYRRRHHD